MTLDEEIKVLEDEKAKQADEFYSREQIIETLTNVLELQGKEQPVYVSPSPQQKPPNYILYAGLAIVAILLLRK